MIRYRPSSNTPGAKRPWLMESEEDSHPRSDAGVPSGEGGRIKASARSPRVDVVGCAVAPTVAASSVANPQVGQNRAASGRPPPQRRQYIAGFYVIGSAGMPGSAGVRAVLRIAASIA